MPLIVNTRRRLSRIFERLSARPLSIGVFAASIALLLTLQSTQLGRFRARAVAEARFVEHPALVDSFVARVHVRVGDRVESGAMLAELSPHFIERALAQVEAETRQVLQEAELARAQLAVDEERWLDQELRRRPARPSLRRETEALHGAQLELLRTRRMQLLEDRERLAIESRSSGRVAFALPTGSAVAVGTSVASVIPEYAEEIVAYVPPATDPALIVAGTPARLFESQMAACRGFAMVRRRGSGVVAAPEQLQGFLRLPVYGMPVYISIPDDCEIGVGQVLSVEFAKGGG